MAAELDVMANWVTDGYANNGIPRGRYEIPDIILGGPYTRKVRVISIGAGVTGILNSYHFQKNLKNIEHVVYEKNPDIGGTWLENRYPGCACDIPSHAYTYGFALNPDWPRFFSYAPDIWLYLNKVCEVWGLRKYMTFSTKVIGCYWQQETGEWLVKLEQTNPDGSKRQFEDRCHMLIQGTGVLNTPQWPNIKGIEKFKGRLIHTAKWPQDYQSEEWKKDRVAVIGSGASSIQTVPAMQPHVKSLDIFVRTGVWFIQIADNYGANHEYTDEQKAELRDPYKLVEHAKSIEDQVNSIWGIFFSKSKAQADAQEALKKRFASMVKDEKLIAGFTPEFGIGCRRVTPGDPYIEAIQKPNVNVHFTPVVEINETGTIGADGIHREVDTIVCATGFDVSYRPQFPLVGQSGIDLREKWKICPEGYLGLAVPGFPNFLIFTGPNWPVEAGGIMGPLSYVSMYTQAMIRKLQTEYICSMAPKQGITDKFNEHCQEWMRHTVWTEDCRSWYKNNETGRVNAVWPGSSLHYMEAIQTPRWEDYEIEYLGPAQENPWAYLGMGTVPALVQKGDVSPYLNVEHLDPKWMEAAHIDAQKIDETRLAELQSKYEEQQKKSRNHVEKASVV